MFVVRPSAPEKQMAIEPVVFWTVLRSAVIPREVDVTRFSLDGARMMMDSDWTVQVQLTCLLEIRR